MDGHVKIGSTWKRIERVYVKIGSTWKEVQKAYVKIGSTWKQFFISELVTLSGSSGAPNTAIETVIDPNNASAGWQFNTDGSLDALQGASSIPFAAGVQWINQAPVGSYWIRAQLDSGNAPNGPTLNSWLTLGVDRQWLWLQTTVGINEGVLRVDIATDSGGSNIVATGYYRGVAEVDL